MVFGGAFRRFLGSVKGAWSQLFFALCVAIVSVVYGMIAERNQLYPYPVVNAAMIAAKELQAWIEIQGPRPLEDHPHIIALASGDAERKVPPYDGELASEGVTLLSLYTYDSFKLRLIDMDGGLLNEWRIPDEIFEELSRKAWALENGHYEIMGVHMYENGDVLFNLSVRGLVKLDRCSNLLWYLDTPTHHAVEVEPDGTIWVPAREFIASPDRAFPRMATPYYEDVLLEVSESGEIIDRISVLQAFFDGNYEGTILAGSGKNPETDNIDPTHLNDLDIIGEDFARRHAFANAGDFLISLRTIDTIAIIDRSSKSVKWALTGFFLRQHDPDPLPDGTISVFDNRSDIAQHNRAVRLSGPQTFGYSRVLRFDPTSQRIVWLYEGSDEEPFYTSVQGSQQVLENGNVMIVETEAGRVFEVGQEDGRIVWEFRNMIENLGRDNLAGRITEATRYPVDYARFLDQPCPA